MLGSAIAGLSLARSFLEAPGGRNSSAPHGIELGAVSPSRWEEGMLWSSGAIIGSFSTRWKGGEGCVAGRVMVSFLSPMCRGERASSMRSRRLRLARRSVLASPLSLGLEARGAEVGHRPLCPTAPACSANWLSETGTHLATPKERQTRFDFLNGFKNLLNISRLYRTCPLVSLFPGAVASRVGPTRADVPRDHPLCMVVGDVASV